MSIGPREIPPVIGHHAGWGLISPRIPVQPYKLTPGATDTMRVRVREKIDIYGVGTDVVQMEGVFIVRRDHPRPVDVRGKAGDLKWGQAVIKAEFRALELYGESPLFGTVRVRLDPKHETFAEVTPAEAGSQAAKCNALVHPVVELPELGLTLDTGGQPVELASKVIQVPPVGDVARSRNSVPLVDENGRRVGELVSADIEVGDVIFSIPLGATERRPG